MSFHNRFRSNKLTLTTDSMRRLDKRKEAENKLRDIAYVLHLTRRVRESILKERETVIA